MLHVTPIVPKPVRIMPPGAIMTQITAVMLQLAPVVSEFAPVMAPLGLVVPQLAAVGTDRAPCVTVCKRL